MNLKLGILLLYDSSAIELSEPAVLTLPAMKQIC